MCDWWEALIPYSISCIMCGGEPPSEHPAQHRQSGFQKETCFSTNHFQISLDPFILCQYPFFNWSVAGLTSSISSSPKPLRLAWNKYSDKFLKFTWIWKFKFTSLDSDLKLLISIFYIISNYYWQCVGGFPVKKSHLIPWAHFLYWDIIC